MQNGPTNTSMAFDETGALYRICLTYGTEPDKANLDVMRVNPYSVDE